MIVGTFAAVALPLLAFLYGWMFNACMIWLKMFPRFLWNLFIWQWELVSPRSSIKVASWVVIGERQAQRIRNMYLKTILRQDIGFFDKEISTGEVIGRMSGDIVLIQDAMGEKGYKVEEMPSAAVGTTDNIKSSATASSTESVSTSKERNYVVVAGVVVAAAGLGWYLRTRSKKQEEVQDLY